MTRKKFYDLSIDERNRLIEIHLDPRIKKFMDEFRAENYKRGDLFVGMFLSSPYSRTVMKILRVRRKRKDVVVFDDDTGCFTLVEGREDSHEFFYANGIIGMQKIHGDMPEKFFRFLHDRYHCKMIDAVHEVN